MALDHGTDPVRWWITNGPSPVSLSCVPGPEWEGWEARYENDTEYHKRTTRNWNELPEPLASGMSMYFHHAGSTWWERLTGILDLTHDPTNHGGGVHVMSPGGWLSTHLDYDLHPFLVGLRRAINLIAFLNPEWHEEWGGALVLCDPMGKVVKRIYPMPGKIVAFEVGDLSYHGVEKVVGPVERVTAAVYYLSPAGPQNTRRRALFMPNRSKP